MAIDKLLMEVTEEVMDLPKVHKAINTIASDVTANTIGNSSNAPDINRMQLRLEHKGAIEHATKDLERLYKHNKGQIRNGSSAEMLMKHILEPVPKSLRNDVMSDALKNAGFSKTRHL